MSFENSPSLQDFQEGLPEQPPDTSAGRRRMRAILGIAFLMVLFLGIANFMKSDAAHLMAGKGAVRGLAVDKDGMPFVGDVFVVGGDKIAHTNTDGSFHLDGVPAGPQSLVVADDLIGCEFPVLVVAGQTVDVGRVQFITTAIPEP